jgi:hypothetical protein
MVWDYNCNFEGQDVLASTADILYISNSYRTCPGTRMRTERVARLSQSLSEITDNASCNRTRGLEVLSDVRHANPGIATFGEILCD